MGEPTSDPDLALIAALSPRRRQVLELIARGLTNDEIGSALAISSLTVRTHVTAILGGLRVTNRTEAATLFTTASLERARVIEFLARPCLTVLPIEALDDGPRTRSVAAGLTRDLQVLFARWAWFPVITPSASTGFAPGGPEQRLDVRFMVAGSLRIQGQTWRLTIRIDDVRDGRCLWSEKYDFPDRELFGIQDLVTETIVSVGYSVLVHQALMNTPRALRAEDLAAWELAHQGMSYQRAQDEGSTTQAYRSLAQAIELEPTLVLAHFGMGLCRYTQALNQWGPLDDSLEELHACALRCIRLAPHCAEGHFLLARDHQTRGDHQGALEPLATAIARNPSFAPAHALLGQLMIMGGRRSEGLERMEHASRLGSGAYTAGMAAAHFAAGAYEAALSAAEQVLATSPQYTFARIIALASAWWSGNTERARRHAEALARSQPSFDPSLFLRTFGSEVESVQRIYAALSESRGASGPPPR